jgi:hypothetical protein
VGPRISGRSAVAEVAGRASRDVRSRIVEFRFGEEGGDWAWRARVSASRR